MAGQVQHSITDQETIGLSVVGGSTVQWTLTVQAWRDSEIEIQTPNGSQSRQLSSGESWMTWYPISLGTDLEFKVCNEGDCNQFLLKPAELPIAEAKSQLVIDHWTFPADAQGGEDVVLPESQLWLPAEWWQKVLSALSLGFRARDPWAPIAFEGVTLANRGAHPVSVLVDTRVVNEDGTPADLFRPRIREGSSPDGRSRVLLSVPPKAQARAVLPIYFDGPRFEGEQSEWTMELRVSALGYGAPLPPKPGLYWFSGPGLGSALVFVSILAALSGANDVFRLPLWLNRAADFEQHCHVCSLETVARLVIRVAGLGAAAVLGPFSIFVTALPDQLVRFSILGALIGLLPKKGVAALMVLVSWLLNGVLSGSLSAVGVVSLLGEMFWLEMCLWAFGITRGKIGAVRFVMAILLFSVLSSASGYALHMVLVSTVLPSHLLAVLLGPGCLYVSLAAALSLKLTHALKRVQR